MNLLPEKDVSKITSASSSIALKLQPGTFVFFNSYLTHQYALDAGIDPFRFVHFNIQCFRPYEENV